MTTDVQHWSDRRGQDIVFNVAGRVYRAGAATARCFRDIEAQFSLEAALATVAAAIPWQEQVRRRWPGARGPQLKAGEEEVLGEALLLAGGVNEETAERLCRMHGGYRNNRRASFRLAEYGFSPPRPAVRNGQMTRPAEPRTDPAPRTDVQYWRMGTNSTDRTVSWWADMRTGRFVAIGWAKLGDLSAVVHDPAELRRRAAHHYPARGPDHIVRTATDFVLGIQDGDIVVAAAGWSNLAIGRVVGPYEFVPEPNPLAPHHRRVIWLDVATWPAVAPTGRDVPEGSQRTLTRLHHPDTLEAIERRLAAASVTLGVPYVLANESPTSTQPEPFTRDADALDRATQAHGVLQNRLARFLTSRGIEPRSGDDALAFDVAWRFQGQLCLAEVKSLPVVSEEQQLRLGLGQVLRYAYALTARGETVRPVLAVEREPSDPTWVDVCTSVDVVLVWPDQLETQLVAHRLV